MELPGVKPRAFGLPCQCSATELQLSLAPTLSILFLRMYVACSRGLLIKVWSFIRPGQSLEILIRIPSIGQLCVLSFSHNCMYVHTWAHTDTHHTTDTHTHTLTCESSVTQRSPCPCVRCRTPLPVPYSGASPWSWPPQSQPP